MKRIVIFALNKLMSVKNNKKKHINMGFKFEFEFEIVSCTLDHFNANKHIAKMYRFSLLRKQLWVIIMCIT